MRITVIGCGYLGATHAAAMAELGHEVLGLEIDAVKREALSAGRVAVLRARPGRRCSAATSRRSAAVQRLLRRGRRVRRPALPLRGHPAAGRGPRRRPEPGRRRVRRAGSAPGPAARSSSASPPCRSAPPRGSPGSSPRVAPAGAEAMLAWNPEFLREGYAVEDTVHPDRIVFGVSDARAEKLPARLLRPDDRRRHPGGGHRLRDRRAGQGRRQRLLGHQDLLHQRDGRGLRGHRRRRRRPGRRDRVRRPDRAALPQRRHRLRRRLPAQGHPGLRAPGRRARRRGRDDLPARTSTT